MQSGRLTDRYAAQQSDFQSRSSLQFVSTASNTNAFFLSLVCIAHSDQSRLIARAASRAADASDLKSSHAAQAKLIAQLQSTNARLSRDLYGDDGEIARLRASDAYLVDAYVRKSRLLLLRRTMSDAFGVWRYQFNLLQQQRMHTTKFIVPYYQRRILNGVFAAWRSRTAAAKRVSTELYWRSQMSQLSNQLVSDYEHSIRELRQQLAKAHEVIQFHADDQLNMESKLKQAFMRGVCAINREAMSVFGAEAHPDATKSLDVRESNIHVNWSDQPTNTNDHHPLPSSNARNNQTSNDDDAIDAPAMTASRLASDNDSASDADDEAPSIHRHLPFPNAKLKSKTPSSNAAAHRHGPSHRSKSSGKASASDNLAHRQRKD